MRIFYAHNSIETSVTKIFDANAPKKAANLSVNSDLLRQAREHGINLSEVLEAALTDVVRKARQDAWLVENREAIEKYNRYVEKHGVFSDGLRRF